MGIIEGTYNTWLVLLSIAISVIGSFTSLEVSRQIPQAKNQLFWILLAAFSLGSAGIWSMHFIGMLAFDLGIRVGYDPFLTIESLLLIVVVTAIGFRLVAGNRTRLTRYLGGGSLMGAGIAGMHYRGMAAMRMPASMSYDPALVILSVAIAVGAATAALWIAFQFQRRWQTTAGAIVMGLAVSGMHYTGMEAATFTHSFNQLPDTVVISPEILAYSVFLVSVMTAAITLSVVDRRTKIFLRLRRGTRGPALSALLLAGIVAIPIAAGWWVHQRIETFAKGRLAQELQTVVRADVGALEIWLERQKAAVAAVAGEPQVRSLIVELISLSGQPEAIGSSSAAFQKVESLLKPLLMANGYLGLTVIDPERRIIHDAGVSDPVATGADVEFIEKVFNGDPAVSRPFLENQLWDEQDGHSPRIRIWTVAPVMGFDGSILAGLALTMQPEADFTRLLRVARWGESGETYAFDKRGTFLSESRFDQELRMLGLIPDEPGSKAMLRLGVRDPGGNLLVGFRPPLAREHQPLTKMAEQAVRGRSGVDVDGYRDYRGVPVVGAWTWLPDYGLGVATEIDLAEAYGGLSGLRGAMWVLLGLLASGAVGIALSQRMIERLQRGYSQVQRLGQYSLVRRIGQGGMGTVYMARHALLRRPTAIKLLRSDQSGKQAITRFEREVRLTSKLTHPNTIAIYDYGRTPEGVFYYAMEYLPGFSLDRLVKEHGPQSEGRVIHILAQACSSLAEAHSVGLIHRDVKPPNIMICERGKVYDVVKVLDFGLVKDTNPQGDIQLTATGVLSGTPLYMCPEAIQAAGQLDARADLYSLAAVGYFLLTGAHIFSESNAMGVMCRQLTEMPERPSSRLGRPLNQDLEELIMRCLEKDPAQRPASALELRDRLLHCESAGSWTDECARLWWLEGSGWSEDRPDAGPPLRSSEHSMTINVNERWQSIDAGENCPDRLSVAPKRQR